MPEDPKSQTDGNMITGWKYHDAYLPCEECKCIRPPTDLEQVGEYQGQPIYNCKSKIVCNALKKWSIENGTGNTAT